MEIISFLFYNLIIFCSDGHQRAVLKVTVEVPASHVHEVTGGDTSTAAPAEEEEREQQQREPITIDVMTSHFRYDKYAGNSRDYWVIILEVFLVLTGALNHHLNPHDLICCLHLIIVIIVILL